MVLTSNKCLLPYCDKLPCALKRIFLDIAECKTNKKSLVSIIDVKTCIESQYKNSMVIENILDCLHIFSHAICNGTCNAASENADIFDIKAFQTFECKCGSKTEVFNDPLKCINFYIEDRCKHLGQSIEEIIRIQMREKSYKICSRKYCEIRESKRDLKILNTGPDCIIIKFIWREKSQMQRVYDLIKPVLRLSDIISVSVEDTYNLVAISSKEDLFYYGKREWMHSYRSFFDIKQLLNYTTSRNQVVDSLIFAKASPIVEIPKSPMRIIEENKTLNIERPKSLYNTTKDTEINSSIKRWLCLKCSNLNHCSLYMCSKCNGLKVNQHTWICNFCSAYNVPANAQCKGCRKNRIVSEEVKTNSLETGYRCEKCSNLSEKLGICTNCIMSSSQESIEKPLSSSMNYYYQTSTEKKSSSQIICSICKSSAYSTLLCIACLEPSSSNLCTKCKTLSKLVCVVCYRSNKLITSTKSSSQIICSICKSSAYSTLLCIACLEPSSSNLCTKCKTLSKFVCVVCYRSNKLITPKASSESSAKRSKSALRPSLCYKCKNSVTNSEKRNCVNCRKRALATPCKNCNLVGINIKYACDKCFHEISGRTPTRNN